MKKVTAFVGCASKKHTYNAVVQFLNNLQTMGEVEVEIVRLSNYRIEICKGCKICFDRGEENCPLKDDRDALIEKMMASDGVVFASPNYSFQVSAMLKAFLDLIGRDACRGPDRKADLSPRSAALPGRRLANIAVESQWSLTYRYLRGDPFSTPS